MNINKILLLILLIVSFSLFIFLFKDDLSCDCNGEPKVYESNFIEKGELEEKIGQMIIIGFRGTELNEDSIIVKIIEEVKIGGVVLFDYDIPSESFPRNIISPKQTKDLISGLQSHSSIPLFIAVDAEGGKVNRLKPEYGFFDFYSAEKLGKIGDYKFTKEESFKLSKQLQEVGFNINFAPVIDVNINSDNPVIGRLGRSFSSDYQEVILHAQAFIEGHAQNNIIAVVKHFPGHGSSFSDSHLGLVDVTDTFKEEELFPYINLQEKGLLGAVMTAHIINKEVDEEYPATLSYNFLNKLLREEIGFNGLIISDDMQMGAISDNYGFEEAIIKTINSGCDILLFSNNRPEEFNENLAREVKEIIYRAVKDGKISEGRISESFDRIMEIKKEFKVIQ
jgi:beta-N-acetylhexosaminidase